MLSILKAFRLLPSILPYGGCQWMRGNYWQLINKGIELALWNDGSFTIVLYEEYQVTDPDAIRILGETDTRELINWSIQTLFKRLD